MLLAVEPPPVVAAPVLRIQGAGKTYRSAAGRPAPALLPVNESIAPAEFVSFVGPSGCGKTTLLKMAAGLVGASEGAITYRDTGRGIQPGAYGFVFQGAALLPWRTVLENVMLPADILGLPRAEARERALRLIELVHLGRAAHSYPNQLSGGMQQRASIARALLHDPEVLFMDEPFGALDAMTREQLNMELQRISREQRKTVLFVTHDIEEAVLLSDRVMVFSRGPGQLVATLPIDLPRPRLLSTKGDARFIRAVAEIRALLDRGDVRPAEVAHG
ncbi:ABC transporter ATP-binding protein [Ramlibacter albus]|uniref:ABC transporter ATP-binding protein n=1 Tax=Ramlibacter albus TaxID=2079448 RepID=A0A923MF42_9BURK|nr:ABC transporter ATP-binding protein [Ramlibacter albus]MBC5767852.1 ABC transporter ATP-binding protein [Ramlibacter albus]